MVCGEASHADCLELFFGFGKTAAGKSKVCVRFSCTNATDRKPLHRYETCLRASWINRELEVKHKTRWISHTARIMSCKSLPSFVKNFLVNDGVDIISRRQVIVSAFPEDLLEFVGPIHIFNILFLKHLQQC